MADKNRFRDLKISVDASDKNTPIYVQIKRQVLSYVQAKGFKQDDLMPDITTIALAAGVSLRTANQAMEALATEGYCYRRPKHGSYYLEPSESRRKLCLVLLTRKSIAEDEFDMEYYRNIFAYGMENKIDVAAVHSNPFEAVKFYSTLDKVDLLGMAVLGHDAIPNTIALAKRYPSKNFVLLSCRDSRLREPVPANCYLIMNDDFDGGYRIVEYYAARGIRSMAILSTELKENDLTYKRRIEGFLAAAHRYGIRIDETEDILCCAHCQRAGSNFSLRHSAHLATREYLARKSVPPDMIFATNDNFALGALEAIRNFGAAGKISVAGYDGLFRFNGVYDRFSSVSVSVAEMGRMALDLISNPVGYQNLIEVKPKLTIEPDIIYANQLDLGTPGKTFQMQGDFL